MKLGPDFSQHAVLADGTQVTLRMMRPGDRDELHRQFLRLSPQSRYRRFLSAAVDLSDESLRYLTEVDGVHHVALVATTNSHDLKSEVGLGVARFARLVDEPDVAEAAVTVVDDAQGKGLGKLLLRTLTEAARERGINTFRAEVLAENTPMRHILEQTGATVHERDNQVIVFDVTLDPAARSARRSDATTTLTSPADDEAAHPVRHLLRLAAESLLAIRFRSSTHG